MLVEKDHLQAQASPTEAELGEKHLWVKAVFSDNGTAAPVVQEKRLLGRKNGNMGKRLNLYLLPRNRFSIRSFLRDLYLYYFLKNIHSVIKYTVGRKSVIEF